MRSKTKLALVVIALGIFLSILVAANKVYHKPKETRTKITEFTKAKKLKPLTMDCTIPEILNFLERAKYTWESIYVEGHSQAASRPASKFKAWVKRPGSYRCEWGNILYVKNDKERWRIYPQSKTAWMSRVPRILAKENKGKGDIATDTPLNDLINPSSFTRKELRQNTKTIEKIGMSKIAGRDAIKLKVTFSKQTAKEDYWDIYVDRKYGIILGYVIYSQAGNPEVKNFIDKVEIDPMIDPDTFKFMPPMDYKIDGKQ